MLTSSAGFIRVEVVYKPRDHFARRRTADYILGENILWPKVPTGDELPRNGLRSMRYLLLLKVSITVRKLGVN